MSIEEQIKNLNETVWCRIGISKIHGIGVFAIRDIPKGMLIWQKYDKPMEIPSERFGEIQEDVRRFILDTHSFAEGQKFFNHPNNFFFPMAFMNYSKFPNTRNHVAIINIEKGEELLEDYEDNMGFGLAKWQRNHFKFL